MAKTSTEKLAKALRANLKRRKQKPAQNTSQIPPETGKQPSKQSV